MTNWKILMSCACWPTMRPLTENIFCKIASLKNYELLKPSTQSLQGIMFFILFYISMFLYQAYTTWTIYYVLETLKWYSRYSMCESNILKMNNKVWIPLNEEQTCSFGISVFLEFLIKIKMSSFMIYFSFHHLYLIERQNEFKNNLTK